MGEIIKMGNRPSCTVPGCPKAAQFHSRRADGTIRFRKSKWVAEEFGGTGEVCTKHHLMHYDIGGWDYKKFRKDYCENVDGRLKFECTYKLPSNTLVEHLGLQAYEILLHVDHIDGNPHNNDPENLQTLCGNCHAIKTHISGDNLTAGRKTIQNA